MLLSAGAFGVHQAYEFFFDTEGSKKLLSHYGPFGDFVGGIANPLIGLVTMVLLLVTVFINTSELKATRKEISQSNQAQKDHADIARENFNREINIRKYDALTSEIEFYKERYMRLIRKEVDFCYWVDHQALFMDDYRFEELLSTGDQFTIVDIEDSRYAIDILYDAFQNVGSKIYELDQMRSDVCESLKIRHSDEIGYFLNGIYNVVNKKLSILDRDGEVSNSFLHYIESKSQKEFYWKPN